MPPDESLVYAYGLLACLVSSTVNLDHRMEVSGDPSETESEMRAWIERNRQYELSGDRYHIPVITTCCTPLKRISLGPGCFLSDLDPHP
jgi:hypothetical protein